MGILVKIAQRIHLYNGIRITLHGVNRLVQVGFLDLLVSQILVQGSSYFLQFVIAAVLGAEEFASVRVTEIWIALAVLPATLGIPTAVIKSVAEKRYSDKLILSQSLSIVLISSHAVAVSLFLIIGFFVDDQVVTLVRILVWSLGFSAITRTILAYFQGRKKIKEAARINTVTAIVGLIITIGLTYWLGIHGWLIGRFLSEVSFAFWMLYLVRGRVQIIRHWHRELSNSLLRLGLFAMLTLLVARAINQGDVILLNLFIKDKIIIGNYGLSSLVRFVMILPVSMIAAIMLPYLVGKLNNPWNGIKFFLQMAGAGALVSFLLCLVVLLIPEYLFVAIMGQDFLYVFQYIRALLPSVFFGALLPFTNNFLVALGRTDLSFIVLFVGLIVDIGLSLWLIPRLGVYGSILSVNLTSIFNFIGQLTILILFLRKKNFKVVS